MTFQSCSGMLLLNFGGTSILSRTSFLWYYPCPFSCLSESRVLLVLPHGRYPLEVPVTDTIVLSLGMDSVFDVVVLNSLYPGIMAVRSDSSLVLAVYSVRRPRLLQLFIHGL